jgi:hypothetical protein
MSDVIFETPDNPIPERASAGFFVGDRSRKIRYDLRRHRSPAQRHGRHPHRPQ